MSENTSPKAARRAQAAAAKTAQDKKYRLAVTIVCCVLVVAVLFVAVFGSNLFYNKTTAVNINGNKFTVADFNYHYFTAYNNYYSQVYNTYGSVAQYISGILPSTSSSFRGQTYSQEDGKTVTWADFFEEAALQRMERVAMLVTEAKAAGYTLTEDDKKSVEETIAGLTTQAVVYGYKDLQAYLTNFYGKGMTEKIFRENLERDTLATSYSNSISDAFTYTPEKLREYYAENADDYDYFTYRSYYFSGAAVTDDKDTEEDETLSAEDAMKKAEADAKAFADAASTEEEYIKYANSLHKDEEDYDGDEATKHTYMGSSLGNVIKDWLTSDDRKPGDVTAISTPEDSTSKGWYVLYFIERDNNQYQGVSGYYALIANDTDIKKDDYKTDEEYLEALEEAAEKKATEILEDFTNGTSKDYDAFLEVMEDHSGDIDEQTEFENSGLYDLTEEAAQWLHDSARKEGDTTVVYSEDYGAVILYYSGNDGVYADILAENTLRATDYNDWETEKLKDYSADTEWEMVLSKKISAIGG